MFQDKSKGEFVKNNFFFLLFVTGFFVMAGDLAAAARKHKGGLREKAVSSSILAEELEDIVSKSNARLLRDFFAKYGKSAGEAFAAGNFFKVIVQARNFSLLTSCYSLKCTGVNGPRGCSMDETALYEALHGERGCWDDGVDALLGIPDLNPFIRGDDGLTVEDLCGTDEHEAKLKILKRKSDLLVNLLEKKKCPFCCNGFDSIDEIYVLSCHNQHGYHKRCVKAHVADGSETVCFLCKTTISLGDRAGLEF